MRGLRSWWCEYPNTARLIRQPDAFERPLSIVTSLSCGPLTLFLPRFFSALAWRRKVRVRHEVQVRPSYPQEPSVELVGFEPAPIRQSAGKSFIMLKRRVSRARIDTHVRTAKEGI